jgi:hypothetical protein
MESTTTGTAFTNDEFYLRYYVGHKGEYGHEFMVNEVDILLWLGLRDSIDLHF